MEPEEHPELADQVERIRGNRGGRLIKLYKLLLHSPPTADGWLGMGGALRHEGTLDGVSRELAITRVGLLLRAPYEYTAHTRYALEQGATPEQIDALKDWHSSEEFDDRLRAVLAYADAMTLEVQVPDDVFDTLRDHFDERQVLELTVNISFYNGVSRFLEAMEIDPE
jgi:alkylhydroperoxidase family enzyme